MKTRALILLLLLLTRPLLAQQPGGVGQVTLFGEEQLKVEAATKTEIPISRAPSAVTVITARQIQESGAHSVADLLRLVAGVNVRWNPMVQTLDVRGFGENPFSNRLLFLIDGVPYNSGDTGGFPLSPAFDLFPVQAIKRIEVVRGPGSSLYGENAYWGVLNIVTLSGEDLAGGRVQLLRGSLSTGSVNAMYGRKLDGGSILGSVRLLQSVFPIAMWQDDHSRYKSADIFLKGSHKDLQLSLYHHSDRMQGFNESLGAEAGFPPTSAFQSAHNLEQVLDIAAFKYNHAPQDAKITYGADVSWSHRDGMHCAACHAATEKPEFSHKESHGYQAIGDFRVGLKMISGHDILLGAEGRRLDRGEHKHELSDDGAVSSGYDKFAVYAQDQFSIIRDRLRAVAGIRYDGRTKLFSARTSPRVALVYNPNDRLVVRGGYGTAFRFPTFSELYQNSWFFNISSQKNLFPAIPLSVFEPNPGLRPEQITTWDVGAEYQISPALSVKSDLYRSRVKDFIVIAQHFRFEPGQLSGLQFENQPDVGTISGGELEFRGNFGRRFTGFANWAHQMESQSGNAVDSSGHPLESVYSPKDKLNTGVFGGPFAGVRASVEMSWRSSYVAPASWYAVRSNFQDLTVHPLPAYTLVNARVSYDIPTHAGSRELPLRVTLYGNNLLDKRPDETMVGSATALAGRQFYAQMELHF